MALKLGDKQSSKLKKTLIYQEYPSGDTIITAGGVELIRVHNATGQVEVQQELKVDNLNGLVTAVNGVLQGGALATPDGYSSSFNGTTNWTLSGDIYYIDFQHNLGSTQVFCTVYDNFNEEVNVDAKTVIDGNTIRIEVTAVPDTRFSGLIVVVQADDPNVPGQVFNFNSTTSWVLDGATYYVNFPHNAGSSNIVCEVYDDTGQQVIITKLKYDNNNLRIIVPSVPDLRFAGHANILRVQ